MYFLRFCGGVPTSFNLYQSSQAGKMTAPVRAIVVGGGCRGEIYSQYASIHPERMKVRRGLCF